jgi:hypothetical protein
MLTIMSVKPRRDGCRSNDQLNRRAEPDGTHTHHVGFAIEIIDVVHIASGSEVGIDGLVVCGGPLIGS